MFNRIHVYKRQGIVINVHWFTINRYANSKLGSYEIITIWLARVIFGGNGGNMTTGRLGLPYPCSSQAKTSGTSLLGGVSNVTVCYLYK